MKDRLNVAPEILEQQANVVRNQLMDMQETFNALRSLVEGSSGYWIGEAAEAHRRAYLNQMTNIDDMFRRYQEHIVDLEGIAGIHREAEAASTTFADELPESTL